MEAARRFSVSVLFAKCCGLASIPPRGSRAEALLQQVLRVSFEALSEKHAKLYRIFSSFVVLFRVGSSVSFGYSPRQIFLSNTCLNKKSPEDTLCECVVSGNLATKRCDGKWRSQATPTQTWRGCPRFSRKKRLLRVELPPTHAPPLASR